MVSSTFIGMGPYGQLKPDANYLSPKPGRGLSKDGLRGRCPRTGGTGSLHFQQIIKRPYPACTL